MPEEDSAGDARAQSAQSATSRFPSVPPPVKRIFDRFPLIIYPANDLPRRLLRPSDEHILYIFTDPQGARHGSPSYNPQCLKWQAYLKFVGINFRTVASNNHASPSGSLPFLLPATPTLGEQLDPIPSSKLQKWAIEQVHVEEEQQLTSRFDVYTSLLDHRIRNAWLYTFYLEERNFNAMGRKLYIAPTSSNSIVRAVLSQQLQQAARDELLKSSAYIDADDLEVEARNAFEALSTLLGSDLYFFGREKPGLFDASVFAYTHLLLDESLGWQRNPLGRYLKRFDNLVQHRERLLEKFF